MDWPKLGAKIAQTAPLLGSLIGDPAGAAAGSAIKLIAGSLGLDPNSVDPEEINQIITKNPEAMNKLHQVETRHEIELQKLIIESQRLELVDIADARNREISITKTTGRRDIQLYALAWIVVSGFFGLCWALMRIPLPPASNDVVFILFGSMASGFTMVLTYFFGSSRSSQDKTQLLAGRRKIP